MAGSRGRAGVRPLLTVGELAGLLQVSPGTVYRLVREVSYRGSGSAGSGASAPRTASDGSTAAWPLETV